MPKAGWITLLQLGQQVNASTVQVTPANIFTLPLTNDPPITVIARNHIDPGYVRHDATPFKMEQYAGTDDDVVTGATLTGGRFVVAMTGAQCALSPRVCQWLFRGLLQTNASALAGADSTQSMDYSAGGGTCTQFYTMYKQMGTTAGQSLRMTNGVINRIAIECAADDVGTVTFDAIGLVESAQTGLASDGGIISDTALCTRNVNLDWDSDTDIGPIAFSMEFNNNAFPVFVDSDTADEIMVGPLDITGSITMEFFESIGKLDVDARSGLAKLFNAEWGSAASDGHLEINFDAKIIPTPGPAEADGFQQMTVNFEGLKKYTGGSDWEVVAADAVAFTTLV
jgi:hypothetical protein